MKNENPIPGRCATRTRRRVAWYNDREEDLGQDSLDELDRLFAASCPSRCPRLKSSRDPKVFVSSLPIRHHLYGIDEDLIVVIAVAHLHRHPRYWADRVY